MAEGAGWRDSVRRDEGSGFAAGRAPGAPDLDTLLRDMAGDASGHSLPFVGRRELIDELLLFTSRLQKPNVLLVGHPGVGKTALVRGLARHQTGRSGVRVVELLLGRLLAGTSHRGDLEQRFDRVLEVLEQRPERTIMFIDEVHQLVSSGSVDGGLGLADLLLPGLAGQRLSVIGATTPEEYEHHFSRSGPLRRRFHVMTVPEPDREGTTAILRAVAPDYERFHGVAITEAVLAACTARPRRLRRPVGRLPDRALTLLDTAASYVRRAHDAAGATGDDTPTVSVRDVARARRALSRRPPAR